MADTVLNESGGGITLEDGSGVILLESTPTTQIAGDLTNLSALGVG